jgi:hypothetical protein
LSCAQCNEGSRAPLRQVVLEQLVSRLWCRRRVRRPRRPPPERDVPRLRKDLSPPVRGRNFGPRVARGSAGRDRCRRGRRGERRGPSVRPLRCSSHDRDGLGDRAAGHLRRMPRTVHLHARRPAPRTGRSPPLRSGVFGRGGPLVRPPVRATLPGVRGSAPLHDRRGWSRGRRVRLVRESVHAAPAAGRSGRRVVLRTRAPPAIRSAGSPTGRLVERWWARPVPRPARLPPVRPARSPTGR